MQKSHSQKITHWHESAREKIEKISKHFEFAPPENLESQILHHISQAREILSEIAVFLQSHLLDLEKSTDPFSEQNQKEILKFLAQKTELLRAALAQIEAEINQLPDLDKHKNPLVQTVADFRAASSRLLDDFSAHLAAHPDW